MNKKTLALCLAVLLALPCAFGRVGFASERTGTPIELNFYSIVGGMDAAKSAEAKEAIEQKIWEDLGINADITIISSDSFSSETIPVKIAAGELDAMYTNQFTMTSFQDFINKDIILPLDELLGQYGQNIYEQIDPKLWDPYKFEGKTYLIPLQAPVPFYCGTWLRMDLFRKYGIEAAPETVSELIEGIKVVQQSEPGMIGMAAGHITWITNSGPLNFHLVDGDGNFTRLNADKTAIEKVIETDSGQPMYWENGDFKQALERYADAYQQGVLDPEIFTTTFDHADQLVASDRVICIGNGYGFQRTADRKAGLDPDYPVEPGNEQEWVFLTNLVNDINGAPTTWQYGYEVGGYISVISTTKYAEEIVRIFDWVCASPDNYALSNWGVEGVHWSYNDEGYVERVKDDSGNNVVDSLVGGFFLNTYSDWWIPRTEYYYGNEWLKIFEEAPTTRTWITDDGFINYSYNTDPTVITDLQTIASEMFVNIVTGDMDLEEGLARMADDLMRAGYEEYYAERNEQYMKGMGY